jgi:hypothetical protein
MATPQKDCAKKESRENVLLYPLDFEHKNLILDWGFYHSFW